MTAPSRLLDNLVHFGRALRAAGLPVGPGQVLRAVEAVEAVGLGDRRDFYWTLHAVFVTRRDQRELFDQAFHLFWRNPQILERMLDLLLPTVRAELQPQGPDLSRRVADAFGRPDAGESPRDAAEEVTIDATLTFSAEERLQTLDFEKMTAAEVAAAKQAIARMRLSLPEVRTRRSEPARAGRRADLRATLRRSLRTGGALVEIARRRPRTRHPPLVVLCDISGSMGQYSRMLLHFLHAVTNDRDRVHCFLFGTRLSNITRHLRTRDVDLALEKVGRTVQDWSGGTRIGQCLHEFNRVWSRRVLGQGALVLLITDGLDRDAAEGLSAEMERLHRSCRRLIWLNPLLRWEGFAPKASGVRAMLPHVDDFRPVHNLRSLSQLAAVLAPAGPRRAPGMERWLGDTARTEAA
ncbi:vWA domain-containing protein [Rhodospirillum centenum]|uniref:CoxE, putative n=1 Tax=Rhodospirillum centenum (strain ATCC 51521 / SW) TaxID=414684 RepID=B6ISQ5_RHOCS|nr:VWA domain-containing protein [Rhodospirillum centenum]ACI98491.1 CoxE, putative [Rhodospirillum centenum SW]